jgi:hypothetical protein
VTTVKENSRWLIGTGNSISFWLDTWLHEPLATTFNFPPAVFHLLNTKVSSFIEIGEWKIPTSILQQDASLRARIDQVIIPHQPLEDRLVWCSSKDGNFSDKQAYAFLNPAQQQVQWTAWIWHNFVPPSTSFVAWQCFHAKMPTDDNLMQRGCVVVSVCDLCLSNFEDTNNLFLSCNFAQHLWSWLEALLHIVIDTSSFYSLFQSLNPNWCKRFSQLVIAAILHVLHAIWLARNGIRFSNSRITSRAARTKILTSLKLSFALLSGRSGNVSTLSGLLQNGEFLQELSNLSAATIAAAPGLPLLVLWRSPFIGWMKVNTDGSMVNASAACGGLFRDFMANFHGGYAQRIGGIFVLHSEIMALILAMELAHNRGWFYLWVESDSMTALRAFDNIDVVPWDLRNRWSNCLQLGLNLKWSHILLGIPSNLEVLIVFGLWFVYKPKSCCHVILT